MASISVHWDDLEIAFERNAPDTESFLDVSTGEVVSIVAGHPEAEILRDKVAGNIKNYVRVDPASSREQYRWMEKFVVSVTDPGLRDRLLMAIDGKGAFRRFKDVLVASPTERERWFTYRAELLHWHIQNWLAQKGLQASAPPPWGYVEEPPELEEVPGAPRPALAPVESPGEALRRQAREIIEAMPAIELPTAIAFLDFLRDRGTASLTAATTPSAPPRPATPRPVTVTSPSAAPGASPSSPSTEPEPEAKLSAKG